MQTHVFPWGLLMSYPGIQKAHAQAGLPVESLKVQQAMVNLGFRLKRHRTMARGQLVDNNLVRNDAGVITNVSKHTPPASMIAGHLLNTRNTNKIPTCAPTRE